jgi:ParB family chromosome partitioning protein
MPKSKAWKPSSRTTARKKPRAFTDEQKAKTGCILKINHNGELQIEYGRMKPSDRKKVEASEHAASAPKKGAKDAGDQPVMSAALAQRLSEGLQRAIAEAMKASPNVAVAALIAAAGSGGMLLDVKVKDARPKWEDGAKDDFLQLFHGAREASINQQIVMLAQIAMQSLSIVVFNPISKPLADPTLEALVASLHPAVVNKQIAEHFDAEDYLKGVSLAAIVAAVRCAIGDDMADKVAKMKKADAVKVAAEQLPKKGWLPPELRTVHYKGPTETVGPSKGKATPAAKKAKPAKAAPAKKAAKTTKKGKK